MIRRRAIRAPWRARVSDRLWLMALPLPLRLLLHIFCLRRGRAPGLLSLETAARRETETQAEVREKKLGRAHSFCIPIQRSRSAEV